MASALANLKSQYPQCGFQSIEVVRDWWLSNSNFGMPSGYTRDLKVEATNTTNCAQKWTFQHSMSRSFACPQYMGYSGEECTATNIAQLSTKVLPCDPCDLRDNPISVTSGSKVQREIDLSLSWFEFYRTFNSSYRTQDGMGAHWAHSLNMRLYLLNRPTVAVVYPGGNLAVFRQGEAADGSGATLREENGGYVLSLEEARYRFNATGVLTRIERYAGDAVDIQLDGRKRIVRVIHSSGRSLDFRYENPAGNDDYSLTYIGDRDGALVTYAYDAAGRLIEAAYRDGSARRYLYENASLPNALTGIEDETGQRFATYAYNGDGMAVSSEHAGGAQRATFQYQADGSVEYTNALGAVETVTFTGAEPYRKTASITRESGTESWTYSPTTGSVADPRRRVTSRTYRSGRIDQFTYQDRADPVFGSVWVKRKTEASNRPESRITETWRRRDTNQAVKEIGPASSVTWLRNTRGQVTQETTQTPAGESRTTTYSYCEAVNAQAGCPVLGLLLSVDGPLSGPGDIVSYAHYLEDAPGCATSDAACTYRKGDLWKTIQPLGLVTEVLAYDGAGRPHLVMDANGVVTEYQYTPRGWMASATVRGDDDASGTGDRVTTMEYLPTGQLSKATAPDGTVVTYTYDAA